MPLTRLLCLLVTGMTLLSGACVHVDPRSAARYVVLVVIDTCRADHLGCYGYARRTSPCIDRVAAQGVVFENAFSQSNESLFSYGSLFSGRYPRTHGDLLHDVYRVPPEAPLLATCLRGYGFDTAAFVAGGHLSRHFGMSRGFDVYEDQPDFGSFFHTVPPAMAWLATEAQRKRSAFLLVHGYDLHAPYARPAPFGRLHDPLYEGVATRIVSTSYGVDGVYRDRWFPAVPPAFTLEAALTRPTPVDPMTLLPALAARGTASIALTEADRAFFTASYDGAISYADTWIGVLFARLWQMGIARQSVVVLIGDHGESLLDDGAHVSHRATLSDATLRVPLVVWAPHEIAARRVGRVVELRALPSTLVELAGGAPLPGLPSLTSDVRGTRSDLEETPAIAEGVDPALTLRTQRFRLVFRAPLACRANLRAALREAPMDSRAFALEEVPAAPAQPRNLLEGQPSAEIVEQAEALRVALLKRWECDAPP